MEALSLGRSIKSASLSKSSSYKKLVEERLLAIGVPTADFDPPGVFTALLVDTVSRVSKGSDFGAVLVPVTLVAETRREPSRLETEGEDTGLLLALSRLLGVEVPLPMPLPALADDALPVVPVSFPGVRLTDLLVVEVLVFECEPAPVRLAGVTRVRDGADVDEEAVVEVVISVDFVSRVA